MATSNKKNGRILDRKLAKALVDLTKILSQKELAKKFKIKKWQVAAYKQYKKRKPFNKKKRAAILRFYDKIKKAEKGEDLLYHYRVVAERIQPILALPTSMVRELIKEIGIERLAKKMKVTPETVKRWQRGKVRIKLKNKTRLFQVYKRYLYLKKWIGLFFLSREFKYNKRFRRYYYIHYERFFYGTKEQFYKHILDTEWGDIEIIDSLIGEKKIFKAKEVEIFLEHLERVHEGYIKKSLKACREFLEDNFKGRILTRLLKILKEYVEI